MGVARLHHAAEGARVLSTAASRAECAIFVTEAYYARHKLYGVSGHVQIPLQAAVLLGERLGRVDFITTKPDGADHLMVDVPPSVRVRLVRHATLPWPAEGVDRVAAARQVLELLRLARRERYRVLHFFGGPKTGLVAALVKRLVPRTRVLYSPLAAPSLPGGMRGRAYAAAFRGLDGIVGTTRYLADAWASVVGRERVHVARPGVLKPVRPGDGAEPRDSVVFWRNADRENGADLMVAAVAGLAPRHRDVRFVFALRAGSEFEGDALRLAERHPNVVTYVQPYPEGLTIERILARAMVVVAPFRRLSINPQMAILESLHAGVPVIASGIESNAEVVRDGETGLVLDRCDADGISRAVDRVLADRALLARMAARAPVATAADFNWPDFERSLAAVYGD